jgi:glycosyltransferase involved in cell wall biosynthesis
MVAFTCEVASKLFYEIFPRPIAGIFRTIEIIYLKLYKNIPTMVISPSTYNALIKADHTAGNIVILPMGITVPRNIKIYSKQDLATIICLGRLNKQKGTTDAIDAFYLARKEIKDARLWLVGSGTDEYIMQLKQKIKKYQLSDSVTFYGFVKEVEKFKLLSQSHVIIVPSAHEGWGLIVPEAGLVKTPAVVYDVPGLRDVVADGNNGYVTAANPSALAKGIIKMFSNKKKYQKIKELAYESAKSYNWDRTAKISLQFLENQ